MSRTSSYPVTLTAELGDDLSRGLWLVKWILAIPHCLVLLVLLVLWSCFVVLSVVAFFAIVFTGRYPASIFDFNVGVMRWTWRVSFYLGGSLPWGGGLTGILVLIAAVTLLVTGTYPRSVFDLVMGLQRWVVRVVG